MLSNVDLKRLGQEAILELGLDDWQTKAADFELEEVFYTEKRKPEHQIAKHMRFMFGCPDRSARIIRIRLDANSVQTEDEIKVFIKDSIKERIRQIYLRNHND